MLALSNVTCPAMIPVAGRPVIQWTMGYLISLGIRRFRIAVAAPGTFVEEFVQTLFGHSCDIEFVVPAGDTGPGGTVALLAEGTVTDAALVVLGDTHFELSGPEVLESPDPIVLIDDVDESYRWCIAEVGDDGVVKGLRDKERDLPGPLRALIGVYWFPDVGILREASRQAVGEAEGRVEVSEILVRVGDRTPLRAERAGSWLDCGNPDRQAAAQRVLLEQRAFNELEVDATFGTITKRSRNVAKFVDEIDYLRLLPSDLSVLFPRLLSWSTDWDDPYVTMEFYGYPTLAELFVFENVDAGIWRRIFEHLHGIVVEGFMSRQRPLPASAVEEMLLGKALERTRGLTGPPELIELIHRPGPLVVNGRELPNLFDMQERLGDEVARLGRGATGSIIHGDLCFSNVLYDLRSGICKLIDPRGSFGQSGIFGDPRYDVAKLYHSVHGLYDFVTADLFSVSTAGDELVLDLRTRPYHDQIRRAFDEVFFTDFDRRDILLVTGLIFVGLPALHYDQPRRQLAFHLRGLELLAEAFDLEGDTAA